MEANSEAVHARAPGAECDRSADVALSVSLVTLAQVPEPSSYLLMAGGLAVLVGLGSCRRNLGGPAPRVSRLARQSPGWRVLSLNRGRASRAVTPVIEQKARRFLIESARVARAAPLPRLY